jgi:adenylate cyclase
MESVIAAIDEFLGEGEQAAAGPAPSGLVTILFTDMEGSTTLTQRLGDAKAQELLRTHNTIVRDALKAHSGSEIKHTGDGIMASFASASRALECAIAIQRALAQHNEANPDTPIRVRIGLNAGEPVAEEEDLFGTAVQLAARICAHAEPGEILAPIVVRELAAGKGFLFADRGDVALRGFEDPVRLYEVRWREA